MTPRRPLMRYFGGKVHHRNGDCSDDRPENLQVLAAAWTDKPQWNHHNHREVLVVAEFDPQHNRLVERAPDGPAGGPVPF